MIKMSESKNQKQGIERALHRIEDINTKIDECENRLNKLKPIDFYQNETVEILKQILKNQYRISKTLSYIIKYVSGKGK